MNNNKVNLIIINGPPASGKSTLSKEYIKKMSFLSTYQQET